MSVKYSGLKVFKFKDKLDNLPKDAGEVMAPVHIRMKPTNRCNHNCDYCAYRSDNLQLGKDMSVSDMIPREKMEEIVADIVSMGVKAVTFSGGGEPLSYPYINDTMKALVAGGVKIASLTNGSFLHGETADILAESGSWVRVSIDGWDDKSYAEYRGTKIGEFTKVINNIKEFTAKSVKCVTGVSIIVGEKNSTHLYDLASLLADCGVNNIKISSCIISNDVEENNIYHKKIAPDVFPQIEKIKHEIGEKMGVEIFNAFHEMENNFRKPYNWCPYLQVLPVIGADMNVYSCQDKAYNLDSGLLFSIKDVSFKEAFTNGREHFYKIDPSKDCQHHCVANSKNMMIHEYLSIDPDHAEFV